MKEELFDPNPVSDLAVKALPGPQTEEGVVLCGRGHSLPPFTLQMVTPRLSPLTVHLNINVLPGQARGAAVNCPVTSPKVQTPSLQFYSEVFPYISFTVHYQGQQSWSHRSDSHGTYVMWHYLFAWPKTCLKNNHIACIGCWGRMHAPRPPYCVLTHALGPKNCWLHVAHKSMGVWQCGGLTSFWPCKLMYHTTCTNSYL